MKAITEHARRSTLTRFQVVRDRTEALCAPLTPEDQMVQSMPDVSPTKWHRAHTSWFFEAFILESSRSGYQPFRPEFAYLFNSYYEGMGERHPRAERGLISRPTADEVGQYRAHVDEAMQAWIGEGPSPAELAVLELGLNHEQQHQELVLMDIKHVFGANPLWPTYDEQPSPAVSPRPLQWIDHDGGLVEIGHGGGGFAYDNEQPRHVCHLAPFALADRPVTCGEWLAFMADDGYRRAELWLSDGWATVQASGWEAPLYWRRSDDGWIVHTLHGRRSVDPNRPVTHVSHYEADAFARWARARLPTEAEWEALVVAREGTGPDEIDRRELEATMPDARQSPLAVGEVWEWTGSAYQAYPGFRPAAGAVGEYNGKFMVNQQVLRGGCAATPAGHGRATYRNFFPSASRWAFSGLRLADDR